VREFADTRLWCLHHIGPDDVHPAPDFATAQAWADYANAELCKGFEDISRFVVAIWPWAPESHADNLSHSIAGWTLPTPAPSDQAVNFDMSPHDDPEFVAAWLKMEERCYLWSEGNIEKAHLGWLMARAALSGDAPAFSDRAGLIEAFQKLRTTAVLLLNNSEGCAANHYGGDMQVFGMPQWLVDCRADIELATSLIASAAPTAPTLTAGEGGGDD